MSHSQGTFFHLFGWGEVVKDAYGYAPIYLVARRAGGIVGLVLLNDVRTPLLGRSLISTAFTVGGGPLVDDAEVLEALGKAAIEAGQKRGVEYVEFRSEAAPSSDWMAKSGKHANFSMPIPEDEAENLKAIPRKRRAELRKALKMENAGDVCVRVASNLDAFYDLYAKSLKSLGTPIFPKRFLSALMKHLGGAVEISFVDFHGESVAALLSFYFKDSVLPYYVGASPLAREARAFDFIYWSQMRRAAARNVTVFDFGRSKIDSGSYAYKKLWGVDPVPLSYHVKLVTGKEIPDVNPNSPKFKYFVKAWTHLPLPVANFVGPILAPNFP